VTDAQIMRKNHDDAITHYPLCMHGDIITLLLLTLDTTVVCCHSCIFITLVALMMLSPVMTLSPLMSVCTDAVTPE
jgi:hypothetical protein